MRLAAAGARRQGWREVATGGRLGCCVLAPFVHMRDGTYAVAQDSDHTKREELTWNKTDHVSRAQAHV